MMDLDDYQPRYVALADFAPRGRIPLARVVLPDGVIDAWAGEADGEPALWLTADLFDWPEDDGPVERIESARRWLLEELRARFGDDGS